MNAQINKQRSGFTLVEVLVALAILLVGILSVVALFPMSLTAARRAAERTITSQTAQSVLGQIRSTSAESLFNDQVPLDLIKLDRSNGIYGFNTSVQRLSGAAEVYLQRVTFTVDFSDGRTESFTTFVTRR